MPPRFIIILTFVNNDIKNCSTLNEIQREKKISEKNVCRTPNKGNVAKIPIWKQIDDHLPGSEFHRPVTLDDSVINDNWDCKLHKVTRVKHDIISELI